MRMFADVRGDKDLIARLGQHRNEESHSVNAVLNAAFRLMLRRRFGSRSTYGAAEVGSLVDDMKYYIEDRISAEDAEALIRTGLGERVAPPRLSMKLDFMAKLIAFVAIARRDALSDEQLGAVLVEAEQAAERDGHTLRRVEL
jgi:hypothetical protein